MDVKFKKLDPKAVIPSYSRSDDACLDLTAISVVYNLEKNYMEYDTGISVAIPKDHVGLIFPRSSISNKNQYLSNSVGVIDPGYTGPIKFRFKSTDREFTYNSYKSGDRVGQLLIIPFPRVNPIEVDELEETERGDKGFGSSGS